MNKGLSVLIIATIVFLGLRYAIPKEIFLQKENDQSRVVDDYLKENITEERKVKFAEDTTTITVKKNIQTIDSSLNAFFKKLSILEREKKGQIRIAYFGDSMVEADMIVMQLRHYMQKQFGGMGVGFVPMTSVSAKGRYSIKHRFSGDWKNESFLRKADTTFLLGLGGETFYVGDTTNIESAQTVFSRGSAYREVATLINPLLLYGKRKTLKDSTQHMYPNVTISYDRASIDTLDLKANNLLNVVKLPKNKKQLRISVLDKGTLPFYGVSFASTQGVIVDNLSVRGNSGLPLSRLNIKLMNDFQKYMDYDLIILGYGTNVFSPNYGKSYAWYSHSMERVVKHLRRCFKNADILIVSMADRAVKINDEMQTPTSLVDFISQQKKLAIHTTSGFFNLYEKMGGAGSMIKWVNSNPALANKDYTHFNSRGAEKVAKLMWRWLADSYEKYKEKNESLLYKKHIQNEDRTIFWLLQPYSHRAYGDSQLYKGVFRFNKDMVCGESSKSTKE